MIEKKESTVTEQGISTEKAVSLLLFSFRISQGDPNLQQEVIAYISKKNPSWQIDDDQREKIRQPAITRVSKFLQRKTVSGTEVKRHAYVEPDEIAKEVNTRIDQMQAIINNDNFHSVTIEGLTRSIIRRDVEYVNSGRTRSPVIRKNPSMDPNQSQVCYYALEGNSAGLQEANELFSDVKESLLNDLSHGIYDFSFLKVLSTYLEHHPHKADKINRLLPSGIKSSFASS